MTSFEDDFDGVDDSPSLDDRWSSIVVLGERVGLLIADISNAAERKLPAVAVHHARDLTSSQIAWCERWVEHPEAVSRLTGLWEGWEDMRADPSGMAAWWREADICAGVLMSPSGPFRLCKTGDAARHRPPPLLRTSIGDGSD